MPLARSSSLIRRSARPAPATNISKRVPHYCTASLRDLAGVSINGRVYKSVSGICSGMSTLGKDTCCRRAEIMKQGGRREGAEFWPTNDENPSSSS